MDDWKVDEKVWHWVVPWVDVKGVKTVVGRVGRMDVTMVDVKVDLLAVPLAVLLVVVSVASKVVQKDASLVDV